MTCFKYKVCSIPVDVLQPVYNCGRSGMIVLLYWQEELAEWLKYQKKKWMIQRNQRKESRKRLRMDSSRDLRGNMNDSLAGFMSSTANAILNAPWQIIQITKTETTGRYKLWVLIRNDLHHVYVNLPRMFYVNYKVPREDGMRK